jgi:DNA-directed RNA polymerase specialized sigma24 family protein
MSGQKENGRPMRGGPRLPHGVEGLIEALRALDDRDSRPLEAWDRERFPILGSALRAWERDAALADRLACRIVREAFSALRVGGEIRSERSWMAAVARRGRAEILERERPIGDPLPADLRAPQGEPIDELIRREECERVRRVIAGLPTKHRLALTLRHLLDRTEAEVAGYMGEHFRIGLQRTREILREGRAMVRTGLVGRNPRAAHPSRYARERKTREISTPHPPFSELHR